MAKTLLKNRQDVEDFVRGVTLLGTGGGGLAENGIESLMSELEAGHEIGWIDVEDVPDDALTVCPFLMGTIAPKTQEVIDEMATYNLTDETSLYPEKERTCLSIQELAEYTGKKFDAVVPLELGGASSSACIAAGAAIGLPTVDGDYTGRAIPEIPQTTPYLNNMPLWPLSVVDEFGNTSIIKKSMDYRVVEKMGKKLSEACYGLTGDTGFMFSGADMKKAILKGTLSRSLSIGRAIREANENGDDPVAAVLDILGGWVVTRGTLTKKEPEDKDGYYWGYHTVTGEGEYEGVEGKIWFKNENHVCWRNGEVVCTSPDSIIVIDNKTAKPYTNPKLEEGLEVAVIVIKAVDIFRSEKGVNILGPRYFGYDFDYVPVEELMK